MPSAILRRLCVLFCLALLLAACSQDSGDSAKSAGAPAKPALEWGRYINAHTTGLVSRNSKVRVRFVNDVVDQGKLGQDASAVLKIEPAVSGSVTFATAREIVLVPDAPLPSGQEYRVKLDTSLLAGFPATPKQYEFGFRVIPQQFEVTIAGLSAAADGGDAMVLNGQLTSADVADADRVEQVLSASFLDQPLKVEWRHSADGMKHEFSIAGVARQKQPADLTLRWDGKPIGVDSSGQQVVPVPAVGVFEVTRVRAVQEDRQFIQVLFSELLDKRQNLDGLIHTDQGKVTMRVDGNAVRVYPDKVLQGEVTVTLEPGIRSASGARLSQAVSEKLFFVGQKPQIKFAGRGVILPDGDALEIPFEAMNVHAVQVTAFEVFDNNIGQFLQTNKLGEAEEIDRVGRYLWRKTIKLPITELDKWQRYSLDASELLRKHPGALFRLTLSINRGDSTFTCPEEDQARPVPPDPALKNSEDLNRSESSGWDFAEDYYGENGSGNWSDRSNPCKDAYYVYADGTHDARNFLASNIGIIAKRDSRGQVSVVTTNLRDASVLNGVAVELRNFQNQVIATATTDGDGFARVTPPGEPFYLLAKKDDQRGYLKMSQGTALPTSHFDVGGEKVKGGIKGYIYGERGVWRPGDDIFLTFVVDDRDKMLPPEHPVTMQLFNPKGQLLQSVTNAQPMDGFYTFKLKTAEDAPTGNWTAKALLGGTTFSKSLKIETVMPNRLKIDLDFGTDELLLKEMPLKGTLHAQWLHGAIAANLKADLSVRLTPRPTRFGRNADFVFDDPARSFEGERQTLFDDELDDTGNAQFSKDVLVGSSAPGMLTAEFSARVFEPGGAFSTSTTSLPFSPYENYVGIRLPKGDPTRGMLLTDTDHTVEIASLDAKGEPVSLSQVEVSLYKINWKWWWDKSGDSLANYAESASTGLIDKGVVSTSDGAGKWSFRIKYPEWGRYLIRACDVEGHHCTGKVFYVDWPGWAGRAAEGGGIGASVLTLTSDKPAYEVGETAHVRLPDATQGRALMTVESGSRLLQQQWVELGNGRHEIELPLTAAMAPNVYVSVALIQPHAGKNNDRPIRLFGVIPLLVNDPATKLKPVLEAADEWRPRAKVSLKVSEAQGREMTYTVAVVDEGLLGLTSFRTPDLQREFYRKEALGVTTWDLYDDVVGSYGAQLERLLALGGGDQGDEEKQQEQRRFPPVVKFMGPFRLKAGATDTHELELPQYLGAVRVMVVAGRDGAYGAADKSVLVREPIGLLPTVPRVVGPEELVTVPVSLFVTKPEIKELKVRIETDDHFAVEGPAELTLPVKSTGEVMARFSVRVGANLGKGHLRFVAVGAGEQTASDINVEVRSANPRTIRQTRYSLPAGGDWTTTLKPHGLPGSGRIVLEMSALPPINLERRLDYLIRYPHGCVEQTTSAVFPQLYLTQLAQLSEAQKKSTEQHIGEGIERLRRFQYPSGGFVYWPGGGGVDAWATNYVGHFLLEAKRLGYQVPPDMLANWLDYQRSTAQSWVGGSGTPLLDQAYRLYTLALAGKPEIGAMNRLRETRPLPSVARWQLAAAYRLAGMNDAASALVADDKLETGSYVVPGVTFGSALRDQSIMLNSIAILGQRERGRPLMEEVAAQMAADHWYSTQSVSWALLSLARYVADETNGAVFTGEYRVGDGAAMAINAKAPIMLQTLPAVPAEGAPLVVRNTSDRPLTVTVLSEGMPRPGEEEASAHGLALEVKYMDTDGKALDVGKLRQGQDFVAVVSVTNHTLQKQENLALTQIVPSGWEIHNPRFTDGGTVSDADYQDIRDDRLYTYFGLKSGESKQFRVLLNATYLGRYYLPAVSVEAMYDATTEARSKGRWVEVNRDTNE